MAGVSLPLPLPGHGHCRLILGGLVLGMGLNVAMAVRSLGALDSGARSTARLAGFCMLMASMAGEALPLRHLRGQ